MIRRTLNAAALIFSLFFAFLSHADDIPVDENGLHHPDWLYDSSFDLRKDLQAAAAAGKDLMVIVEQVGCHYCEKMHLVNFQKPEIQKSLSDKYLVIQLDLWGDREVTGFDGVVRREEDHAAHWRIGTTPASMLISSDNPMAASLSQTESVVLPGYLIPFYHLAVLDYFADRAEIKEQFQTFVDNRVALLNEQGIDPEMW